MIKFINYDPSNNGFILQSGFTGDGAEFPSDTATSAWLFGQQVDPERFRINLTTKQPVPYTAPTATTSATAAVNTERDRRIAQGFVFDGKLFQVNIPNISAAMSSATAATISGSADGDLKWYDPNADFGWIAMDNSILTMDARTMIMFGQTATAFNSSFYTAARTIKNRILAGETLVITDNALWPTAQTV